MVGTRAERDDLSNLVLERRMLGKRAAGRNRRGATSDIVKYENRGEKSDAQKIAQIGSCNLL